jgi:4-amino-4-deoxy-L-arabinose transferase-like glycosyltransferase
MYLKAKRSVLARNAAIVPAIVTIVCLIPFANKAFHIDDPLFIWAAKQIQSSPADFYGFTVNWGGNSKPMAEVTRNPPVTCYYIAIVASLFGWSEAAMHIAFLIPAAGAAVGTYYLARKFCSRPVLAALAAILTPGFLVSSTNIMCDIMMLAFWVWAVFFWVQGIEANKRSSLFFAAVLAAICALTKYFGIALPALLFVYSIAQKRRPGGWMLFLLIPVVILAGYYWVTHILYGHGLLSDAAAYAIQRNLMRGPKLLSKGLTGLLFAGGCIATALFYSPLLWSKRVLISSVVLTILFILVLILAGRTGKMTILDVDDIKWYFLIQIGLMAMAGANILWLTGADFWKCRNAESLLLLLWVLGTFIFAGFINWTINARSILPMIPAIGILLMRRIDRYGADAARRTGTWVVFCPLVPAALLALSVCWADYTWANTARTAAATIHKTFENTDRTVWFQGHWGFQYYMETAGCKAIDFSHPEIAHADIIIIPSNNTDIIPLPKEKMYFSSLFQFTPCQKLATMDPQLGAGFYTDVWGPLPFAIGPVGTEKYRVFINK